MFPVLALAARWRVAEVNLRRAYLPVRQYANYLADVTHCVLGCLRQQRQVRQQEAQSDLLVRRPMGLAHLNGNTRRMVVHVPACHQHAVPNAAGRLDGQPQHPQKAGVLRIGKAQSEVGHAQLHGADLDGLQHVSIGQVPIRVVERAFVEACFGEQRVRFSAERLHQGRVTLQCRGANEVVVNRHPRSVAWDQEFVTQNQARNRECAYRWPAFSATHYLKETTMHAEATATQPQKARPRKDLK